MKGSLCQTYALAGSVKCRKHSEAVPAPVHDAGRSVLQVPVDTELLKKLMNDPAWATARWDRGAGVGSGYRYDVLGAIVLRRAQATGTITSRATSTANVFRASASSLALGMSGRLISGVPHDDETPLAMKEKEHLIPHTLVGLSATQMKSSFRCVVLNGCAELDLVSSWLFCALELAKEVVVRCPTIEFLCDVGLEADNVTPRHHAQRARLATESGVPVKVIKGFFQRIIGGGVGAGEGYLREAGGIMTVETLALGTELRELCAALWRCATPAQKTFLEDKPRPARSFMAHCLMSKERSKIDLMVQLVEARGHHVAGFLGDGVIFREEAHDVLLALLPELAAKGVVAGVKSLRVDIAAYLLERGIVIGQPVISRSLPRCGPVYAEAWLKSHSFVHFAPEKGAPHSSLATVAAAQWDLVRVGEKWWVLDPTTQVWDIADCAPGLAGETTSKILERSLVNYSVEYVLDPESGKFKAALRIQPPRSNLMEDDSFLSKVAHQIREKPWPRRRVPENLHIMAFQNGLCIDWLRDPWDAIVPTQSEWMLTRLCKCSLESFPSYLQRGGKSAEDARRTAARFYNLARRVNDEKRAALRDVRDAFSGQSQANKRITAFAEFGCASSNKGGRREMDELTFGTHVPPEHTGYVFKITASEMCAKSQRGPWESAANSEGSRLGYSDEWSSGTLMNNATFKAFHSGNSLDLDRKHKSKRQIDVPPPLIYIANEPIRFADPVVDGEDRRWHVLSCKIRLVPADDYDPLDETLVVKDPTVKKRMAAWTPEYIWVLLCLSMGVNIVQDDLPFPAPKGSFEMVRSMLSLAAPATTVQDDMFAVSFVREMLERCPVGYVPSSRTAIQGAFYAYAADKGSRARRPALLGALELVVSKPTTVQGSAAVSTPFRRSYQPYLLGGTEPVGVRMYRLLVAEVA